MAEETTNGAPAAVVIRPTVTPKGITVAEVEALAAALGTLEKDDAFASDGKRYESQSEANKVAAKFIRAIESRYDVELRSRTWEPEPGQFVFGIRPKPPKDEGEAVSEDEQGADASEQPQPVEQRPAQRRPSRTGRREKAGAA